MKVWHRGRITDPDACRVSVLDHGLLYGDGVFEGIRITQGRVFRLDCHLQRLERSARSIGLDLPLPREVLADVVLRTAAAHGEDEAYVRLLVTRGEGALGIDPASCARPELFCIVAGLRMYPAAAREAGVRLGTAWNRRPPGDVLDPQVKSLNYLNNVLARREAGLRGFDDALMLNLAGNVAEASGANVFAVVDGTLVTPPAADGALPGVTRDTVLRCARYAGWDAVERTLSRHELMHAREAFLCGSGAGLIAVASLDDTPIGDADAARARRDRPALAAMTAAYAEASRQLGTPWAGALEPA